MLDLLCYLFGEPKKSIILESGKDFSRGEIIFKKAKANYFLSIREKDIYSYKGKRVIRDFFIELIISSEDFSISTKKAKSLLTGIRL